MKSSIWQILAVGGLVLALSSCHKSNSNSSLKSVEATEFVLRDGRGNVCAKLTAGPLGEPDLEIYGTNRNVQMRLGLESDIPTILLLSEKSEPELMMQALSKGTIVIYGKGRQPKVVIDPDYVTIWSDDRTSQLFLGAGTFSNGDPIIRFFSHGKKSFVHAQN